MSSPNPLPRPVSIPIFLASLQGAGRTLRVACATFPNGRLAVYLTSGHAMYCRWAINVPALDIGPSEFFAKTYDENEELREPMLATGLFVDTGLRAEGGFVDLELWRLTPVALQQLQDAGFPGL